MTFSERSLRLLPTNTLVGLKKSLTLDKAEKQKALSSSDKKISKITGEYSVRTPQRGRVTVSSAGSAKTSQDQKSGMIGGSLASKTAIEALRDPLSNANGDPVYVPGSTEFTPDEADLDILESELDSYFQDQSLEALDAQNDITNAKVVQLEALRATLTNEVTKIQVSIDLITTILDERKNGVAPNPRFNIDALDGEISDTAAKALISHEKYVENQIIQPFAENARLLSELKAQVVAEGIDATLPRFDLAFGPPISTQGKYILSEDGLYYDSRTTSSVPEIDTLPVSSQMWNLDFAPNKGGKGVSYTEDDAIEVVGTIFDINADLETNEQVEVFYKNDDLLDQFISDKQSHLNEVSGYISELLGLGYDNTDATVQAYIQQLGSTANIYDKKIQKRRRQLQVAALFGGRTFFVTNNTHPYGEGLVFVFKRGKGKSFEKSLDQDQTPDKGIDLFTLENGDRFLWDTNLKRVTEESGPDVVIARGGYYEQIPRIPVNDFSYLQSEFIPVGFQRKLTLFSEDLDDVVLPYQPSYVVSPVKPRSLKNDLYVDPPSVADFVHRTATTSVSANYSPLVKSLTDNITTEGLLLCYNFLDPGATTSPSSNDFFQNNYAEGSTRLDAKIVAYDNSFAFPSGVGIPYFGGTLFDADGKYNTLFTQVKGSYVRLPNIAKDFQDTNQAYTGSRSLDNLFYAGEGATIEAWVHVPNVWSDMTDSHRYRLLLANENSSPSQSTWVNASNKDASQTLGMIMGWRDRGSPEATSPYSSSGLEFIIAPTVGQNSKSSSETQNWGHSVCLAEKYPDGVTAPVSGQASALGMIIASSLSNSNGSGIGDVSAGFCHVAIRFDRAKDQISFFLDGESLVTSSMSEVFGLNINDIKLPTPVKQDLSLGAGITNNPAYSESWLGDSRWTEQPTRVRNNLPVFTPWIIGGGFTDGLGAVDGQSYKPMGFLGSNTNSVYQGQNIYNPVATETFNSNTYIVGQHQPPLSSNTQDRVIPRSGLDGHIGSFKIYDRPLTNKEVDNNYEAQRDFFKNIVT